MTMRCPESDFTQCSGWPVLRLDRGIALTASGVQVFGASTSDLLAENPDIINARGFDLRAGGPAEMRVTKDNERLTTRAAMLLAGIGLSWDQRKERPRILETFSTIAGRVAIDGNQLLTFGPLPASTAFDFFDYATKGVDATQAHYANNIYFPRSEPLRCPAGYEACVPNESGGFAAGRGGWREFTGGAPDSGFAARMHGDGDIHAGSGVPDATGLPTILVGGNGQGIPYPGSKGYRYVTTWNYRHANLAAWFTQDTAFISEWGGAPEHNKNRRGIIAFGEVTDPAQIPATGTVTWPATTLSGWHGAPWTGATAPGAVASMNGQASLLADFAAGTVTITVGGLHAADTGASLPVGFTVVATMGARGSEDAGYFSAAIDVGGMSGSVAGRFFGPAGTTASPLPTEIGAVFRLSAPDTDSVTGAVTGRVIAGGMIGRRQ